MVHLKPIRSIIPKGFKRFGPLWIVGSIFSQSSAFFFAKLAAIYSTHHPGGPFLISLTGNIFFAAQILALALQTIFWLLALRTYSLSFAYPFMSLVCVVNLAGAHLFFGEAIYTKHYAGIMLIMLGIFCIAFRRKTT